MNTAAFADHSVISRAHWPLAVAVILSFATSSAFLPLIMLQKLYRLNNQWFEICGSLLEQIKGNE